MKGETILCFSPDKWNGMWRERQQIMSRLSRDNRVLYIEPERDPDISYVNSLWSSVRNLPVLKPHSLSENLVIYSGPPSLPYAATALPPAVLKYTSPAIRTINCFSMIIHARRILGRENVETPVLFFFGPYYRNLVGHLGEKLVCYYVYDEIAEFPRNAGHREFVAKQEAMMTELADVVFASSRSQYNRRSKLNERTYFTPHGVDFDHYSTALSADTPIPEDIAGISTPIAGYIGTLDENLDADLLDRISRDLPEWSLVLVGPDGFPKEGSYDQLKQRENVHLLGRKDVGLIPGYLKAFDVAILPYQIIGQTKYAYPCKIHEYLASGKPVVAYPLPELLVFRDVIALADSPDQFVRHIRQAGHEDNPRKIEERLTIARSNTWDQRVDIMREAMDSFLSSGSRRNTEWEAVRKAVGQRG